MNDANGIAAKIKLNPLSMYMFYFWGSIKLLI